MRGVGGLNGWRWIFILEGILTVLVSLVAYFFIANYPATAKFLTEKERLCIHARLSSNSDATRNEAFTWANVRKALSDPKVWLYGLGFHTMSLPLYTLSLFRFGIELLRVRVGTVPAGSLRCNLLVVVHSDNSPHTISDHGH